MLEFSKPLHPLILPNSVGLGVRLLLIVVFYFVASSGCGQSPNELILFDFETDRDLDHVYWKCHTLFSLSGEHATHGTKSLKMALYPSPYPGFAGMLTISDWSVYRKFSFDIYNPAEEDASITVRIDDRKNWPVYDDRYNEAFLLKLGWNHVEIPLDSLTTSGTRRRLDTRHIERFLFFSVNPDHKIVYYLDFVRLIR